MKVAVINFSGNVGKSTIARHLLAPRIAGAELISVESINADVSQGTAVRGSQFGMLQEYLQTVDSAVVDIGASNVEDLLALMRKYRGSHEDFDCFVVPTVPALKQQQDTVATLAELAQLGITPGSVRIVFNLIEDGAPLQESFATLLGFLQEHPLAIANPRCRLGSNEVFQRIKGSDLALADLALDTTDYKSLIAATGDTAEKVDLAQRLATRRLARGVVPGLDACFEALGLG